VREVLSTSRPGEGRDPYRVIYRWSAVADAQPYRSKAVYQCALSARRGVWVPAFAGTTIAA